MTAGIDLDASIGLVRMLREAVVRANPQLARKPRRFGAHFRKSIGERLGRVSITPVRTEAGEAKGMRRADADGVTHLRVVSPNKLVANHWSRKFRRARKFDALFADLVSLGFGSDAVSFV